MKFNLKDCELLAPAGSMAELKAAINFGANAVYVGLTDFSMRAKAKNFTSSELEAATLLAHANNCKVYVATNIMMHESDLHALSSVYETLEKLGVDAVLVGDLGALALAKKYAPHVDIHISTQAAVCNSESAKMFYELGAKRVVLAREMTLAEISVFTQNIPADLEVEAFVHGAQCMAESQRCLISAYLCDRSANRGECTQPCRWKYSVIEEKRPNMPFSIEEDNSGTYLFNACDLCMIEHLKALADSGVYSFKIEGRNKKAFYVASVVNAYRQVMQGGDIEVAKDELMNISHRPYSTGFYFGEPRQSLNFDGYAQETLHLADVLSCEKCSNDESDFAYQITVRCRNKIEPFEEIEALSPDVGVVKGIKMCDFEWVSSDGTKIPQETIGRTGEVYVAKCNKCIADNSLLRKRETRITSREK